jgi:hypothetical protein
MFPFLSVLCCVIGVLILFMLLIVSTRIVDARQAAAVSPRTEQGSGLTEQDYLQLQLRLDELAKQLADRTEQLGGLLERRDELMALVVLQRTESELASGDGLLDGAQLVDHPVCKLIPVREPGQRQKQPRFIEVDAEGFLVQPGALRFSIRDLPPAGERLDPGAKPTTPLQIHLRTAYEKRANEYLLFLVRPNGIEAFDAVKRYVIEVYPPPPRSSALSAIDLGWEPFAEEWSLLAQSEEN